MATIYVIRGDKLYDINFTLLTSTGSAVDLTGATLTLAVQNINSNTIKFTGSMNIVNATAGTCKYNVQATDFTEVGQYSSEIRVSYPSGTLITFSNIAIVVQSDLPS